MFIYLAASSTKTPARPIPANKGQSSIKNFFKNQSSPTKESLTINYSIPPLKTPNIDRSTIKTAAIVHTKSSIRDSPLRNQISINSKTSTTALAKPQSSSKQKRRPKVVPTYKIVEGTTYAVDAFQFGEIADVTHYFLTHFHSDHYIGLKKSFCYPLHVSVITGKVLIKLDVLLFI